MVHNIADITPGGTPTALKSSRTPCNWLQVVCPSSNAAAMRVGDSTTSATSGISMPAGAGMMFPPIGDTQYLDLALVYIYGTTTDKVSIVYGTH